MASESRAFVGVKAQCRQHRVENLQVVDLNPAFQSFNDLVDISKVDGLRDEHRMDVPARHPFLRIKVLSNWRRE